MRHEAEQERGGDREPEEHHDGGLELVHGHLDEEIGGAPDRG
jgi:hypothetical protein